MGYAFTDRIGGASPGGLSLGGADRLGAEAVRADGRAVRTALGVAAMYAANQVHGTDVLSVTAESLAHWSDDSWLGSNLPAQPSLPVADALLTSVRDVALLIRTADCLPVLIFDERAGVIAAVHAGRVGLAAGILPQAVAALQTCGAEQLRAVIGPAICGECYEVPVALREEVSDLLPGAYAQTRWGTPALDLPAAARRQLVDLGCVVESVGRCTRDDPALHSYRRDGAQAGRLGALVWMAP